MALKRESERLFHRAEITAQTAGVPCGDVLVGLPLAAATRPQAAFEKGKAVGLVGPIVRGGVSVNDIGWLSEIFPLLSRTEAILGQSGKPMVVTL